MSKIALIDMDGTLVDYHHCISEALHMIASPDEEVPHDLHNVPDWLDNRIDLIKNQPGFWREMKPIRSGMVVLQVLKAMGYKINILTKGPHKTRTAWTEKTEWCDRWLPGVSIAIVDAKDPLEHKGLVYGKVLFDDYPPYVEAWLANRPRGKVIMLEHDYNKEYNHERVIKIGKDDSISQIQYKLNKFLETASLK